MQRQENDVPVDELGWTMIELHLSVLLRMRLNGTYNIHRQRALNYITTDAVQFLRQLSANTVSFTEFIQFLGWHRRLVNIHAISNQILAGLVMDAT